MGCCLHIIEEGRASRYVREGIACGRCSDRYPESQHDNLGHLAPGGVVIWPECAIGIARDSTEAVYTLDIMVEVVGGVHIREVDGARSEGGRGATRLRCGCR